MSQLQLIAPMLDEMVRCKASDLYMTVGAPPCLRTGDEIRPLNQVLLTQEDIERVIAELLDEDERQQFQHLHEFNGAFRWDERARFRLNLFRQQRMPGMVIRRINTVIPTVEELGLPQQYRDLVMMKRGLVLVVGTTASGKSTSLAAMLGYRNLHSHGHIITVEDPIEYVHEHGGCLFTQREVGLDTESYPIALKNALRQRPDVLLIGEIRDMHVMEQAMAFAETGHLCLATMHANYANQAIHRIVDMFPEERHRQIYANLALNLRGVLAQRLVRTRNGGRVLAVEVMLNEGSVKELIRDGRIGEIKNVMEKATGSGMQTFDHALMELYRKGLVSEEDACNEADNPANLSLRLRQMDASFGKPAGQMPHLNQGLLVPGMKPKNPLV